jgi:uncharacterized protein
MDSRRVFLKSCAWTGLGAVAAPALGVWDRTELQAKVPEVRSELAPTAFAFLPLTAVRPMGWLKEQLQIQANGLSGHLEEVWKDVGPDSGWLGGKGESWERGPYYLDGYLPLAYLLDDAAMKNKAQKWMEWTLNNVQPSGMIGPASNDDWWPRMVMLKVLAQYQEATGDTRVVPVMTRYCEYQLGALPGRPLKNWGKFRWQDEAVVVLWLYERTGNPKLLELARLLHDQGYDWQKGFEHFEFTEKTDKRLFDTEKGDPKDKMLPMMSHGVNNGMGLKHSPVWYRVSGSDPDRKAYYEQMAKLDEYHGLPTGIFSSDEHLAGRNPSQGTELCTVVEIMYSLEQALAVLGEVKIADRLEKIAFNALPAALTDDMWAHQYDQQPNQVRCDLRERQWTTNGPESNLFGLEPNFGCCTANFHQGWPKLVSSMWMRTPKGGLAAVVYGPNLLRANLTGDVPVEIEQKTSYPFRESVIMEVRPQKPARFELLLRIPEWARGATVNVNGRPIPGALPGNFTTLDRTWKLGDRVELIFPMKPRVTRGFRQSVTIERGPIVFSLPVPAKWSKIVDRGPASDWQAVPAGDWNYALELSPEPDSSIRMTERRGTGGVFTEAGYVVQLTVKGSKLSTWEEVQGSAGEMPENPVTAQAATTDLTLIPYGAAKLRVTAFPQRAAVSS